MKVSSDSSLLAAGEGVDAARRLVEDDSLGATEMRIEKDGYVLHFEGLRTGTAMLFREERENESRLVALDAYDTDRIIAIINLVSQNPAAAIASIEWQEDEAGVFGYAGIAVAIVLGIAAFYGLYIEFFQ